MIHDTFSAALLLLGLSVFAVTLLRRLHLPPVLGYLAVGLTAGPHALGWLEHGPSVEILAEAGLVFLLFSIGLEVSLPQFLAMGGPALSLGGMQVLLTALAGGAALHGLTRLPWTASLVAGAAMALSSTAIAAKQLSDQLEINSLHGRLALGILLLQDLAVVPVLVVMPLLSGGAPEGIALPLLWALAKGVVAFAAMLATGRWLLRPLFHHIAALHSSELFMLTVLLVSLTAAWITHILGLSLELGAFLAGMMLAETEYLHQIKADVRPFRDVLMGLFFVGVGMRLDLAQLPLLWPQALALLAFLVAGKGLLIALLARLAGYDKGVALSTGLVLAQGGEFSFVLLTLAINLGLLSDLASQPLIAALVLSMLAAPFAIRYNVPIATRLFARSYLRERYAETRHLTKAARDLHDHVILCGFGRIGQILSHFLRAGGIHYIALDLEPARIKEAHEAGEPVFYGDATHREILSGAGIRRARVVVVTVHDAPYAEKIVQVVRRYRPDVAILVRVHNDLWLEKLEAAGASKVVPEKVEAAMVLAQNLLHRYDVTPAETLKWVESFREDHYLKLRGLFVGEVAGNVDEETLLLHTVVLPEEYWGADYRLGDFRFEEMNVSVATLLRHDGRIEQPPEDLQLAPGDVLVLQGRSDAVEKAQQALLGVCRT